jgi:ketol-acid reductoisomerase
MASASRAVSRALRSAASRQAVAPLVQKRSIAIASKAARATVAAAPRIPNAIQQRGVKTIDFAGTPEVVYGTQLAN